MSASRCPAKFRAKYQHSWRWVIKLYIVGNGFDLWHRLPTSYRDFYGVAKDTLDEIDSYFRFDIGKDTVPWHDFENRLGTFDWRSLYEEHDNTDLRSDDFKPSDVYGLEDELTERSSDLVEAISDHFEEWVAGLDISSASKQMDFEPNARFFTFNYTSTLQELYEIEESSVFHVHGRAGKTDLLFGHGVQIIEEPEFDSESGESNRTMFSDAEGAAKSPLYVFKKPVEEIIEKHRAYFTSLGDISEVVIIGHSLNEVDIPYFRAIASHATGCNWSVYCFERSDWDHHPHQLMRCGISPARISTLPYANTAPSE
jgi:Bacteriophage abortive infection AbiH